MAKFDYEAEEENKCGVEDACCFCCAVCAVERGS